MQPPHSLPHSTPSLPHSLVCLYGNIASGRGGGDDSDMCCTVAAAPQVWSRETGECALFRHAAHLLELIIFYNKLHSREEGQDLIIRRMKYSHMYK